MVNMCFYLCCRTPGGQTELHAKEKTKGQTLENSFDFSVKSFFNCRKGWKKKKQPRKKQREAESANKEVKQAERSLPSSLVVGS